MIFLICKDKGVSVQPAMPMTTYSEEKHGRVLFRITGIYKGEIDFAKTVEDLIVKKILMHENTNLAVKN